jgi:penicillin-binding protein 2
MSFHPNDMARRARGATAALAIVFGIFLSAFFRTQVLHNSQYALRSEENRLSEVPIPAPRAVIYDRKGLIIAENVPGYSVSILSPSEDSLRASLARLGRLVDLDSSSIESAARRYQRAQNRPTVIFSDASFDLISVLEEHRVDFPDLIIQSAPKRVYPDGPTVASFVGYTAEITETELAMPQFESYKAGQQVGKSGLELQYEGVLRGQEGKRFVEVDARGRVVREAGAREELAPRQPPPLYTNIDLELQRHVASLFGDSLQGGLIALDPRTGDVLALHSAPSFDPNRFIGGIPQSYWNELRNDPRRPLFNKVLQGRYPPASTFKLATAAIGLERGIVDLNSHMPVPCAGGYLYGNRYFRCWNRQGHGDLPLSRAIAVSCNVYFYQLGLKLGLARLLAGGIQMGFGERSGLDIPNEGRPGFPDAVEYYNQRYGARGWSSAVVLNLAIGQGENQQTVASMARFYSALATDGHAVTPHIVRGEPERIQILRLTDTQAAGLRAAMSEVVTARGTAGSAAIEGVVLAGKTGTAQNSADRNRDHAWFAGFAPADDPKIVVAVMLEFGEHGYMAARVASRTVSFYLKAATAELANTDG